MNSLLPAARTVESAAIRPAQRSFTQPPRAFTTQRRDANALAPDEPRKRRADERHVVGCCEEFYESDCQGRFSSLLVAFSSFPLQSAPSVRSGTIVSASGWAEQSFSAGSCSVPSIDPWQTIASDSVITTRVSTTVLSETRARRARPVAHSGYPRGTMVSRVPRR